jgi:NitT/TauT family transport system ATP-binding protein
MSPRDARLRIGFIPLTDATALLIAVDKGFTIDEGLDVELVREVSWSNVRDKLNIGLFDGRIIALLRPLRLGLGQSKFDHRAVRARRNGNAITVSPSLCGYRRSGDGDIADPMVPARALARVVRPQSAR